MKIYSKTFYITVVLALTVIPVYPDNPVTEKDYKIGLGLQAHPFPNLGISGIYNFNPRWSIQVLGMTGLYKDYSFIASRGIFKFISRGNYNLYANCLVGYFILKNAQKTIFAPKETDKAWGAGLGTGFEFFFKNLPQFGWNIEVDYLFVDFKKYWWNYDQKYSDYIMVGTGVHYYFLKGK